MHAALLALCTSVLAAPAARVTFAQPQLTRQFKGKTVLFVGDSMIVNGLDIWARHWVKRNGGTYRRHYYSSSTTKSWAETKALDYALAKYKPHIVFIVLGSNELFIPQPQKRARHIRTILRKLGKRAYRWIGPPAWAPDTGIIKVLARTLPSGRFYPFNKRRIARAADGKHPTVQGSRTWAQDIFTWYMARLKKERRP